MSIKKFAKFSLGFARHPAYVIQCLRPNNRNQIDFIESVRIGADWLLRAQACAPSGQGYSRRFSLIGGWDRCYIETTGYIVPTLLNVSNFLGTEAYHVSAIKAANWLLSVQTQTGAFTDIDYCKPQVFDTGQVLFGLNRVYRDTRDERYLSALKAAGRWLVDEQEADGSWVTNAYNHRPHAYYTRVAAALIEAGQIADIEEYVVAGVKNLEWATRQRQTNGYYKHSEFRPDEDALLHTIVYVLEGFACAYELTLDPRWANQLITGVEFLQKRSNPQGILHAQYDPDWNVTNKELCITGLAQYAGICFDVARISKDAAVWETGERVLQFLLGLQQRKGKDIEGALQSSVPLWGYYGGMEFFNWNIKFYLDAILKYKGYAGGAQLQ